MSKFAKATVVEFTCAEVEDKHARINCYTSKKLLIFHSYQIM